MFCELDNGLANWGFQKTVGSRVINLQEICCLEIWAVCNYSHLLGKIFITWALNFTPAREWEGMRHDPATSQGLWTRSFLHSGSWPSFPNSKCSVTYTGNCKVMLILWKERFNFSPKRKANEEGLEGPVDLPYFSSRWFSSKESETGSSRMVLSCIFQLIDPKSRNLPLDTEDPACTPPQIFLGYEKALTSETEMSFQLSRTHCLVEDGGNPQTTRGISSTIIVIPFVLVRR